MGAKQSNIQLAGDIARRMESRKRTGANPKVMGERLGQSSNSTGYEQVMQRMRDMRDMKNTGSIF